MIRGIVNLEPTTVSIFKESTLIDSKSEASQIEISGSVNLNELIANIESKRKNDDYIEIGGKGSEINIGPGEVTLKFKANAIKNITLNFI